MYWGASLSRLFVNLYNYKWKLMVGNNNYWAVQCSCTLCGGHYHQRIWHCITDIWMNNCPFVSCFISNCTVIKWELKRVILVLYLICSVGIVQSRSDNRLCNRRFSCSIECWIWLAKNPCAIVMRLNPGIPLIVLLLQYYRYIQCTVSKDWINLVACMGRCGHNTLNQSIGKYLILL